MTYTQDHALAGVVSWSGGGVTFTGGPSAASRILVVAMLSDQFGEPEQLRMFMSAREIAQQFRPGDAPAGPGRAQLFSRKLAEARASGLHQSVAAEGVQQPIDLAHSEKVMLQGHHRLASAMDTAPDRLIPVLHHESFDTYHRGWGGAEKAWPGR